MLGASRSRLKYSISPLPREKLMKNTEFYGRHGGAAGKTAAEALST
jgi:hypothetical protein